MISALRAHMAGAHPASHRPHHSCPVAAYTTSNTAAPSLKAKGVLNPSVKAQGVPSPSLRHGSPRPRFSGLPGAYAPSTAAPQGQAGGAGLGRSQSEGEDPPPQPIQARSVPPATPFPSVASPATSRGDPLPAASPHRHLGAGLSRGKTPPPTPAGGPRG